MRGPPLYSDGSGDGLGKLTSCPVTPVFEHGTQLPYLVFQHVDSPRLLHDDQTATFVIMFEREILVRLS